MVVLIDRVVHKSLMIFFRIGRLQVLSARPVSDDKHQVLEETYKNGEQRDKRPYRG